MKATILDKIMLKYAKKGKFTPAVAKDIGVLCRTVDSLLFIIQKASCNAIDNSVAASVTNNTHRIIMELEKEFLERNK